MIKNNIDLYRTLKKIAKLVKKTKNSNKVNILVKIV